MDGQASWKFDLTLLLLKPVYSRAVSYRHRFSLAMSSFVWPVQLIELFTGTSSVQHSNFTGAARRDACRYCLHQYSVADLKIVILSVVLAPWCPKKHKLWSILDIPPCAFSVYTVNRFSSWIYLRLSFLIASDMLFLNLRNTVPANSEKIGANLPIFNSFFLSWTSSGEDFRGESASLNSEQVTRSGGASTDGSLVVNEKNNEISPRYSLRWLLG